MSDDATNGDARYQERIIMADRPHIDGLTRGTVVEYDGWQWGVVTEIAEETEPTKVGFVLLDEIGDWIVRQLEDADGCAEHYQAVRTFRDGEHEYWTPAEYIQNGDAWEILGPIHPDAREGELVTDGGVDQSEAEVEHVDTVGELEISVNHVVNSDPLLHTEEYEVHAGLADELVVPKSLVEEAKTVTGVDIRNDEVRCSAEITVVDDV